MKNSFSSLFEIAIPQSVWTAAFGLAQPPCVAGLPYSASGISHRFEYKRTILKPVLNPVVRDTPQAGFAVGTTGVFFVSRSFHLSRKIILFYCRKTHCKQYGCIPHS
ncbi:MAG: hypothetical protein FWC50_00880 [Planctomycetaceae bacterium]|nr:hypothetical protein [Planctomycetaceae bacterium]